MKKEIIIFLCGAAFGGAAAWFYQEWRHKDHEDIEQEEFENIFGDEIVELEEELEDVARKAVNKPNILDYKSIVENESYIQEDEEKNVNSPYIIEQDEFRAGAYADFGHVTMYYFNDGVVVDLDDPDSPIVNEDEIHFLLGDCLENADLEPDEWIYIRNIENETDYEIQYKDHEFSEREDE